MGGTQTVPLSPALSLLLPLTLCSSGRAGGNFLLKDLHACMLSRIQHFATLWTSVAGQASLSMRFSRQEYWSELPSPPPGDLPDPGNEPRFLTSLALAGVFFITSAAWKLKEPAGRYKSPAQSLVFSQEPPNLIPVKTSSSFFDHNFGPTSCDIITIHSFLACFPTTKGPYVN